MMQIMQMLGTGDCAFEDLTLVVLFSSVFPFSELTRLRTPCAAELMP